MTADAQKRATGEAAMAYVSPHKLVGVGTGSTVNHFIDALAGMKDRIPGAVSSSEASTQRLREHGIPVYNLKDVDALPVYIDGADEVTPSFAMTKGGGGALTREKIVAAVAEQFICIVDASKRVDQLGAFPLPVEVIPLAQRYVAAQMAALGGDAMARSAPTDNGNAILDVHGLDIPNPAALEQRLNNIPGIVTVGLFAMRRADRLLVGGDNGVATYGA